MITATQLLTRRTMLALAGSASIGIATSASAAAKPAISVSKDPNCGCCMGWVEHLRRNGFVATVVDSADMQAVKVRPGVPRSYVRHTAEIAGVIEGHVPARAINRLLTEKP